MPINKVLYANFIVYAKKKLWHVEIIKYNEDFVYQPIKNYQNCIL